MIGIGVNLYTNTIRNSFSPSSLNPALWYDISDASTLFQDTAGTIPVTADGQSVALIKDKSANGRNITQSTAILRPIYRKSGSQAWLEMDGTKNLILSSLYNAPTNNFAVAWCSLYAGAAGANSIIYGNGGTWVGDSVIGLTSPAYAVGVAAGGGFSLASVQVNHVSVVNINSGNLSTFQNNVAGNTNSGTFNIAVNGFSFDNIAYLYSGKIYGGIIVPRGLTALEIKNLSTWMGAKAGLSI